MSVIDDRPAHLRREHEGKAQLPQEDPGRGGGRVLDQLSGVVDAVVRAPGHSDARPDEGRPALCLFRLRGPVSGELPVAVSGNSFCTNSYFHH